MKSFITAIGIGLGIASLDYYVILLWKQILNYGACAINPKSDVIIQTICWGTDSTPFLVLNVVAIGSTLGYIYQVYRTIVGSDKYYYE